MAVVSRRSRIAAARTSSPKTAPHWVLRGTPADAPRGGLGDGHRAGWSAIAFAGVGLDDARDDVALDKLTLLAGGLAEGGGGEAIEIAHGAGGLVEEHRRVEREDLAVAAGAAHAQAEVLGGVVGSERRDLEAVVEARVQRAVATEAEAVAELGEADEDEREERAAVPGVVEQDVQVLEGVLVQQVGLVEWEHGGDALLGALLDVATDGVEQAAGGGAPMQPTQRYRRHASTCVVDAPFSDGGPRSCRSRTPWPCSPSLAPGGRLAAPQELAVATLKARVLRFCGMLDQQLATTRFLAGDEFSIADIA